MDLPKRCRVSLEAILDYIGCQADEISRREVQAHLDGNCSRCSSQLYEMQRLLPAMRASVEHHAPATVLERAKAIHRDRFRMPARVPLFARLISDSRAGLALAGARGAERSGVRMVYDTDDHEIDLWQERETGEAWYLIGQVVDRNSGVAIVPQSAILTLQTQDAIAATSEAGEFHLADVPAGRHDLRITIGEVDIVLAHVAVGETT